MLARMDNMVSEPTAVIRRKLDHILADAFNGYCVFRQSRVARMQIVKPQEQAAFLVEYGIAQAVVQRIQITAKKLREIYCFNHRPQYGGAAARAIAFHNKSSHPDFFGDL